MFFFASIFSNLIGVIQPEHYRGGWEIAGANFSANIFKNRTKFGPIFLLYFPSNSPPTFHTDFLPPLLASIFLAPIFKDLFQIYRRKFLLVLISRRPNPPAPGI